jgi:hypothetical protein
MLLLQNTPVQVPIGKHMFLFRRLTWEDDLKIVIPEKTDPRRAVLAQALVSIDGRSLTLEEGTKAISLLRTPVLDRVFTIFNGSLPPRRKFEVDPLWEAPEPKVVRKRIDDEEDTRERAHDDFIRQSFEPAELAENEAIENAIVANSGFKGAVKLNPDGTRVNPFLERPLQ